MPYDKNPPLKNLNKGYADESSSQEDKDLLKFNPVASHASKGSFMSKHSNSSPLSMYGKQESPAMMYGGKKGDDSKSKKDYE